MLRARGSRWFPGGGELRPHEKLVGPVSGSVGISLGLREAEGEIEEREREMRKSLENVNGRRGRTHAEWGPRKWSRKEEAVRSFVSPLS